MSKEKQIEGMAEVLRHVCEGECIRNKDGLIDCEVCKACHLYEAGYRKQSVGEWVSKHHMSCSSRGRYISYNTYACSVCGKANGRRKTMFCPKCGARMGEGAE
jgi:hypothetical protein